MAIILVTGLSWYLWERFAPPKPFGKVVTLAGAGARIGTATLGDPFGVAADGDDVYITDGLSGSLYRVSLKGEVELITDKLDMPSHLAVAPDGSLIVANTGAHTIVRVDAESRQVSVIAGTPNVNGYQDGKAAEAKFHAPVGVTVDKQGVIYVADTYNDRIRVIDRNNEVRTLAGSVMGKQDGQGTAAQFDTPCGLAILNEQELLVADTGNGAIRNVTFDGNVRTVKLGEDLSDSTGKYFYEPIAILTYGADEFYFAESGGSKIWFARLGQQSVKRPPVGGHYDAEVAYKAAGDNGAGLVDSDLNGSRLNRPTGLALIGKNTLVVADSGNGLVRAIVPANESIGTKADPAIASIKAEEIRKAIMPRWPFEPPDAKREIAGTLGEIRGEVAPEKDAWFHNGFDIPGAYGEQVRALYSERVSLPLAVEGVGNLRERLRLPLLGYIHLRIGRDQTDQPIGIKEAIFQRDEKGKVIGARIPRGTRISAGDIIGTLNAFNHVHLIAGRSAAEVNALAALELPGLVDTIAPRIEALRIIGEQGEIPIAKDQPVTISGKVKFVVRAYDQVDGNAGYRKLGVYQVGYQLLMTDGVPWPELREPQFNIEFNRLPADPLAVHIAYAEPSQSGYTGKTIFDYIATNVVRDGLAREEWFDTSRLPRGEYVLRMIVADYFGNRSTKEQRIKIG